MNLLACQSEGRGKKMCKQKKERRERKREKLSEQHKGTRNFETAALVLAASHMILKMLVCSYGNQRWACAE